jgi:hypothetical protein
MGERAIAEEREFAFAICHTLGTFMRNTESQDLGLAGPRLVFSPLSWLSTRFQPSNLGKGKNLP